MQVLCKKRKKKTSKKYITNNYTKQITSYTSDNYCDSPLNLDTRVHAHVHHDDDLNLPLFTKPLKNVLLMSLLVMFHGVG